MTGNIVLNERACAESALENLSLGTKPVETIRRVGKYYYSLGYKKAQIAKLLEEFLIKCDPNINIVKWQGMIDSIVKSVDKYKLIEIAGIPITKSEIEAIRAIDTKHYKNSQLQRLMFTMLCLAKYSNALNPANNNWVNRQDKEIFSLANIVITSKRQSLMINDLWKLDYIGYSKVVDNININVKIVDDTSEQVLFIDDFRNLGNQYLMYFGDDGKYKRCECCGKVVKVTSGRQKYCPDCAVDINRQKAAERYRRLAAV